VRNSVDPYIASLALTYCDHFVPLDPIHHHISVGSRPPSYIRWIPSTITYPLDPTHQVGDELVGVNGIGLDGQALRCDEIMEAENEFDIGDDLGLWEGAETVGLGMLGLRHPGVAAGKIRCKGRGGDTRGSKKWSERDHFRRHGGPKTTAQLVRLLGTLQRPFALDIRRNGAKCVSPR
jgi:hypothetical protein